MLLFTLHKCPASAAVTAHSSGSPLPRPPGQLPSTSYQNGSIPACLSCTQEVPLTRPATVLGRSPAADLMLDHQSISRQHAAICWHAPSSAMVLVDLGSVHGSWVDGKRADAGGQPLPLAAGSELRLGASTRKYVLRSGQQGHQQAQQQVQQGQQGQQGHKRPGEGAAEKGPAGGGPSKRVRFAGEGGSDGEAGQLEQVIGYAERGSSFSLVGPRPVKGQEEGRFAAVVQSTTLPRQHQGVQNDDLGRQREGAAAVASPRAGQPGAPRVATGLGARSAMQIFNQQLQQKKQQQQQQEAHEGGAGGEQQPGGAQQLGEGAAGGGLLFAGLPPPKNG